MMKKEQHERITRIVHDSLSPLLTDSLGMEHGWDAAEGVASAIMDSGECDSTARERKLYATAEQLQASLKQHMRINIELSERLASPDATA